MATKSRVVLFALIKEDKVLIEKRPVKGFSKLQYLIPGGAINKGETLAHALKREMMEELGIIPTEFELLTEDDLPGLYGNVLKPFIVTCWKGEVPNFILDKEDPFPLEWIEIEETLNISIKHTRNIFEKIKKHLSI